MAIQIERNENGNCVNFKGATQPVYWNNCLTAVAVGTDRINIQNDIRSAGAGQTYYEYFNVKIEDFCDNNGASFANATAAEFTLLPLSSEIVEKDIGAAVTATGGTVLATPVAFTN